MNRGQATFASNVFDRRSIPANAREGKWRAPDGWELRRIDFDQDKSPARGSLLFSSGRADFYEKYLETFHNFHEAGWNVTCFDWRGQGGSGRCGPHDHVGHIDDFSIWTGDLAAFFEEWRKSTPGPHVVIGHSMGGHIVQRALNEQSLHPDAVILSTPMLAPAGGGMPEWTAHLIAKILCWAGRGKRRAWKGSDTPLEPDILRRELLTHDEERYADEFFWFIKRPFVRLGPASWRWVERAYASTQQLRNRQQLKAVTCPVLMLATSADELVDNATIEYAVHMMPHAELRLYGPECAHEIFREVDPVREQALEDCFSFLDRVAPAQ